MPFSQNPRMTEVGRDLWSHMPTPCSSRDTESRGPRPMASQLLKVSKEETPSPLDNLCQCSSTAQHSSAVWCSEGAPVLMFVPMASYPGTGQH